MQHRALEPQANRPRRLWPAIVILTHTLERRLRWTQVAADHHKHHLLLLVEQANSLMAGPCPAVYTDGTIPAPTAVGACYTLTFPTNASVDFHATVNTAGVDNVAFFTAHMPTEFEGDMHYFMSTDLQTDVEPEATTDALEYNCKFHKDDSQVKVCAQAFLVIQAHHDYCPHDTLTRWEEELFHEWEGKCATPTPNPIPNPIPYPIPYTLYPIAL